MGHAKHGRVVDRIVDRVGESSIGSSIGSSIRSGLGRGPLGAIGHLGYTGCSLWIDRDLGLSCALLTNHVHPDGRRPAEILALRQSFHDAVAEAVAG